VGISFRLQVRAVLNDVTTIAAIMAELRHEVERLSD